MNFANPFCRFVWAAIAVPTSFSHSEKIRLRRVPLFNGPFLAADLREKKPRSLWSVCGNLICCFVKSLLFDAARSGVTDRSFRGSFCKAGRVVSHHRPLRRA